MTIAKERLGHFNYMYYENKILNCSVTDDEMCVQYAEAETNGQPKQWKQAGSPPLKKFKLSSSAGKVLLVAFWNSCGIILAHFMPKGQTVTARYYSEVILKKRKLKKLHSRLAQKNVLLHDNALSFKWPLLFYTPYSSDLALLSFHCKSDYQP